MKDHGDVTRGESVSTYPCRPKAEVFSNAIDVVERLRDATDPSTERTAPPCSAHVQHDEDPRTPIQQSVGEEFHQHDGMLTILMFYCRRASPKHYNDMTEVCNCGGGHRTRLKDQLVCLWGAPSPCI